MLCVTANILNTLRRGGNILIAVDTAGRVLELSQLLVCVYNVTCLFVFSRSSYMYIKQLFIFISPKDQMWRNQESGLCAYHLALLNNVSYNVVEFAKSQVSELHTYPAVIQFSHQWIKYTL